MDVFLTPTFSPTYPVQNTLVLSPYNDTLVVSPIYVPSVYIKQPSMIDALKIPKYLMGDVCNINNIKEKVTKIVYYKILDKWLYDDMIGILGYFKVTDDKVSLIKSLQDKTHAAKEDKTIENKIKFIENNILTQDEVYSILKRFINGTNVSWCDIPKNGYFVKETIEKYLIRKIEKMINTK